MTQETQWAPRVNISNKNSKSLQALISFLIASISKFGTGNFIPHKIIKFICIPSGWILNLFYSCEIGLNWPKDIQSFNPIKYSKILLNATSNKCSNMIEAKRRYTSKLRIDYPSTMPRAYIFDTFLSNKKIPKYPSTKCTER